MSAQNSLTTPLIKSIPSLVDSRSQDKNQISPQAIPVTISKVIAEGMIEVQGQLQGNFTLTKMVIAVHYGEWLRHGHAVGDKGYVILGSNYMGGQTNLGGGTASYRGEARGNLTTAAFHPLSNTKFKTNANRNLSASLVSGPQGAVINEPTGNFEMVVNGTKISIKVPTGSTLFLGGDGVTGTYSPVVTSAGPSINVKARIS